MPSNQIQSPTQGSKRHRSRSGSAKRETERKESESVHHSKRAAKDTEAVEAKTQADLDAQVTASTDEKTTQESIPDIVVSAREACDKISSAAVSDDESAEWLRKAKLDPHFMYERDPDGHSPLTAAAAAGKSKTLRVLVKRGGDVKIRQPNGHNALTAALLNGHFEICEYLTSRMGMDLNAHGSDNSDKSAVSQQVSQQALAFVQHRLARVERMLSGYLPTTGGTMSGNIDMGGTNEITNIFAIRFPQDVIIGEGAFTNWDVDSVAIGKTAECGGDKGVALGLQASAYLDKTISIGYNSFANGLRGVVIGAESTGLGTNANCYGSNILNDMANSLLIAATTNFRASSLTCDLGTTGVPFQTLYLSGSISGPTNTRTADNIVSNASAAVAGRIAGFADTTGKVLYDTGFTMVNQCGYKFVMPGQNTVYNTTAMTSMTAAADKPLIGDLVFPALTIMAGTLYQLVLPAELTLYSGNVTINATMNGTVICTLTLATAVTAALGMIEAKFIWRHGSALEVTIIATFNGIPTTFARARLVANSGISNTFDLKAQPSATSTNLATTGGYMTAGRGYMSF